MQVSVHQQYVVKSKTTRNRILFNSQYSDSHRKYIALACLVVDRCTFSFLGVAKQSPAMNRLCNGLC